MKKFGRFASMLLAVALVFSFSALPASAADQSTALEKTMVAAVLSADDCEIQYAKNGTVRIITATLPAEQVVALTRATNPLEKEGTAEWDNVSEITFQCRNGWGKNFRAKVENKPENTCDMTVEFTHNIDGEIVTSEKTVAVGDYCITLAESKNGEDLTCSIDTTISPYRGVAVDWVYYGEQT